MLGVDHYRLEDISERICSEVIIILKERIVAALDYAIQHGNHDRLAAVRRNKRTL